MKETFTVHATMHGSENTFTFLLLDDALQYVREFVTAAYESGCADEFAVTFEGGLAPDEGEGRP